jgi:pyridoxine 5-phosphate synthase
MSALTVSLDLVGVMREAGHRREPDPAQAAVLAELAGARGISVMLRRDRKYLRDRDLYILKNLVKTKLNVAMPPVDDIIDRAIEIKPYSVTFVADLASSESPAATVDFYSGTVDFSDISNRLKGVGVRVIYFIEPEIETIKGAYKAGADSVLLNCGPYAEAPTVEEARAELDKIDRAAQAAIKQNLGVYCGRGLHYNNIQPLVELGNVREFIVGRSICTRALFHGFERAVQDMIQIIENSPRAIVS